MARLPVVGSDSGEWGELLNEYLGVEHDTDGTHKALVIEVSAGHGVEIHATSGMTAGEQMFTTFDSLGAPIFTTGATGGAAVIGDTFIVANGVFAPFTITMHPTRGLVFGWNPSGPAWVGAIHSGSGTPATFFAGLSHQAGEYYFRTDTPSTANQRIYVCTVAGTPGTWVGIV